MQRLWSRAASAQSTCRCVSCYNTGTAGVASRGATAASKRRLRIGNSVTVFYSSIFAAAALADAQAKDRRRVEWEQKIAAVKEDVNVLVNEEHQLLSKLESRGRRGVVNRNGLRTQTRLYSTTAPPVHEVKEDLEETTQEEERDDLDMVRQAMEDADDELEDLPKSRDPKKPPNWLSGPMVQQKAIRLLALKQLSIRLLLRPAIAHNYNGLPVNYDTKFDPPPLNVAGLLNELRRLRIRIRHIAESSKENVDDVVHELRGRHYFDVRQEKIRLDAEVERDAGLYLGGRMTLPEFLLRLAGNLARSTDPDRPLTFKIMLLAFTQTRQNDLGDLLLQTLLPNGFQLTSPLIISILNFFRKKKDLKTFDLFLRMLRGEGYPVNLGKMPKFRQRTINGIDLTIPPLDSSNPVLYGSLITASLRFNQPERADAYFQAARATGYMDDYNTLFAFLRFYAIRKDWWNGLSTLKRAVAFMGSTSAHVESLAERLIFFMVYMCDACEKHPISEAIIAAAMDSGFEPTIGEKQWDLHIPTDPLADRWQKAADSSESDLRDLPLGDKCLTFADMSGKILTGLGHLSKAEDPAWMRRKRQELFSRSILTAVRSQNQPEDTSSGSIAEPETETGSATTQHAAVQPAPVQPATTTSDYAQVPRDNEALNRATMEFEKQNEEIVLLKRGIKKLQDALNGSLATYQSQLENTVDQNQAITALQNEIRDLRKTSQSGKDSQQSHVEIARSQDREIESLRYEIDDLRKELAAERESFAEHVDKQNRMIMNKLESLERREHMQFDRTDNYRGNGKATITPSGDTEPQDFNSPKIRFMFSKGSKHNRS